MKRFPILALIAGTAILLGGCSMFGGDDDSVLPGERVSILELQRNLEPDNAAATPEDITLPEAWRNDYWPQAGGYPNHSMQNVALNNGALKKIWSVKIGQGTTKRLPLTAQPIVVDGRIFTIDTASTLSAFSVKDGKRLWRTSIDNPNEGDTLIGGGVAYSRGRLYVTTGSDEVLAVSPADGKIIWRVDLPAPARAAPTVTNDQIFVSTLDNRILSLNALDGAVQWEYNGISESAGLIGAASPAASTDIVVPAFSSGELFALRIENGSVAWTENLSAFKPTSGLSGLSDIRGLPVIDKGAVIAVSFGGRIVAIDERTGERIWQREIGSAETPWVAGNSIFIVSTDNELVSLSRENGAIRWIVQLPRYKDPEDRKGPIFWTGPLLAGGRLITAGTHGEIIEADSQSGKILRRWDAGKGFSIPPIVTSGVLFLLANDGTLSAYK